MIPEEAVESAATAIWPGGTKEQHRLHKVRKALELAAPHIIQSWIDEASHVPPGRVRGPIYPLGKIEDKRR